MLRQILRVFLVWAVWHGEAGAKSPVVKRSGVEFRAEADGGIFPDAVRANFAATLKEYPRGRFARAYRGERASLHRYFVRAQTVFEDADENPALGYLLLKLLLGSRDYRYSRVLETEDFATRQAVGRLLDPLLTGHRLSYPQTRATYHRHRPRPRPATVRD